VQVGSGAVFKSIGVQQIACGSFHTLLVTKTQELYVWGSNTGHQLGAFLFA
jgi:alpha-tubulin suppressor-like RCC1 family protein